MDRFLHWTSATPSRQFTVLAVLLGAMVLAAALAVRPAPASCQASAESVIHLFSPTLTQECQDAL